MAKPCIFCSIIARDTPARMLEGFNVHGFVAFYDHRPQLRTHVIIASREHIDHFGSIVHHPDARLVAEQFTLAQVHVAELLRLHRYRVIINNRVGSIPHLHAHLLSEDQ